MSLEMGYLKRKNIGRRVLVLVALCLMVNLAVVAGEKRLKPPKRMQRLAESPITSVALGDEAGVWFYEPFPGHILVSAVAKSPDLLPPAVKKGLGPVELYKKLARKPAPPALIRAFKRVLKRRQTRPTPQRKVREYIPEEETIPIPDSDFCSDLPAADYSYCWRGRRNTAFVQAEGQSMTTCAYTYQGFIRHTYKYYRNGNTTTTHVILPEGWISWFSSWCGSPIVREVSVDMAENDCYHFYVYGDGSPSSVTAPSLGMSDCYSTVPADSIQREKKIP
jgi:hypothetical protein